MGYTDLLVLVHYFWAKHSNQALVVSLLLLLLPMVHCRLFVIWCFIAKSSERDLKVDPFGQILHRDLQTRDIKF